MIEHPDAFGDALSAVNALLPPDGRLTIDALWGDPPHFVTVTLGDRVLAGRGETPAAALRDLAKLLAGLSSDGGWKGTRP